VVHEDLPMSIEQLRDRSLSGQSEPVSVASDLERETRGEIKDSPLSHQGSGGPGDDRQDNSSASPAPAQAQNEPESTPATDKHRIGSSVANGAGATSKVDAENVQTSAASGSEGIG
jgi:hypothetical protein